MSADTITVTPLAGALGAEVGGLDLVRSLDDRAAKALRDAWLKHLVLFFRDQPLSSEGLQRLASHFGTPVEYPFLSGLDGFPAITPVIKEAHEKVNFGGCWHSDTAYLECPPQATMLIAREVPPYGGDTLFANMYLAYENLSEGLRDLLDDLIAVNTSDSPSIMRTKSSHDPEAPDGNKVYTAEHPVVRTHPETGLKALYINSAHTVRFRNMTVAESSPLLQYLFAHITRPEYSCRFRWQVNSIAIWDNRCTQHNPINDYDGFRRVMHRVTLGGDRPV
jgi:taurine dioxygenase